MNEVAAFLEYLKHERRYSSHTLLAYENDLKQFLSYLETNYGGLQIVQATPIQFKSWIYDLSQSKLTSRSINRKLISLNSFYKHSIRSGTLATNPIATVRGPKVTKHLADWVREDNLEDLNINFSYAPGFIGLRDELIIELLYGTGIRLNELVTLTADRLYLQENTIKVLGKRNKERIVPINKTLKKLFEQYLESKKEAGFDSCPFLLVTDKGLQLYPVFVQRTVKRIIGAVATNEKISPHLLRHTFATHLLNRGADINSIKELLGHTSLAATQIYTHNSIEKLKDIYKQAHPKG